MRKKALYFGLLAFGVGLVALYIYYQNRAPAGIVSMSGSISTMELATLGISAVSMLCSAGCFIIAFIDIRSKRK